MVYRYIINFRENWDKQGIIFQAEVRKDKNFHSEAKGIELGFGHMEADSCVCPLNMY